MQYNENIDNTLNTRGGEKVSMRKKIGKKIKTALSDFFNSIWSVLVVLSVVVGGLLSFTIYAYEQDNKEGRYEMVYKVYWTPNNVKEYTITNNRPIIMSSSNGSNKIYKKGEGTVVETNAPIEIIKYVKYE